MMKRFDCSGTVSVVIGGTGVLGGAMAEGLAEAGSHVVVIGRNRERGESRVESIVKAGGKASFKVADALCRDDLQKASSEIQQEIGKVQILVNAAGGNDPKVTVTPDNAFVDIPIEAWRANFDLNLVGGVLLPCQVFGPSMMEQGKGSIINIASVSAHIPLSRVVSYSASKAAVLSLTQFLAREWASKGVRVNSITPGFFPAEQNRKLLYNEDGTPTDRAKAILGHTPAGRFGEAKELVGAVLFLASHEASSFVTGSDVRVDGGYLSQTI